MAALVCPTNLIVILFSRREARQHDLMISGKSALERRGRRELL